MVNVRESTALVYLSNHPAVSARQNVLIKRLALVFDRIEYALPELWAIDEETFDNLIQAKRTGGTSDDTLTNINFDPFHHPVGALKYPLDLFKGELPYTIQVLEDHGIAAPSDTFDRGADRDNSLYKQIKHDLAWQESRDPTFVKISGSTNADFTTTPIPLTLDVYGEWGSPPPAPGEYKVTGRKNLYMFALPPSMLDSSILSDLFYDSSERGVSPVLLSPTHRLEMRRRYELYQQGLPILKQYGAEGVGGTDPKASFGEVSFIIANGTIDSSSVASKSVEEIIKYRLASDDARRRLVSENLWGATKLVEDNPWDNHTRTELERYIQNDLASAILKYQEQSAQMWQKYWGTLPVAIAEIGRDAIIAGMLGTAIPTGGVLAEVIPDATGWGITLAAGVVSAARKAPGLTREIVAVYNEHHSRRRNGISYLANFR